MWSDLLHLIDLLRSLLADCHSNMCLLDLCSSNHSKSVHFYQHHFPVCRQYACNIEHYGQEHMYDTLQFDGNDPVDRLSKHLCYIDKYTCDKVALVYDHVHTVKLDVLNLLISQSNREFKDFVINQVSGRSGAGILHKYTNRENVKHLDVSLCDRSHASHTPDQAIDHKLKLGY